MQIERTYIPCPDHPYDGSNSRISRTRKSNTKACWTWGDVQSGQDRTGNWCKVMRKTKRTNLRMYVRRRRNAGRRRQLQTGTGRGCKVNTHDAGFPCASPCGLYLILQYIFVPSFPFLGPLGLCSTAPSAFVSVCFGSLVNKPLFLIFYLSWRS